MNSAKSTRRAHGFTLVEMLVVIAIIGILAALLLPVLEQAKARAKRVECVSDLTEFGVAFHLFANDHGGKFPTQVSTNDGGSMEFAAAAYQIPGAFYFAFKFVRPLAGALGTPKVCACPADLERPPATNFNQFSNSNLSYDVGMVADANDPRLILAADRGLPAYAPNGYSLRHVPAPASPRWSGAHGLNGNILFADGHVELSSDASVASQEAIPEDVAYPSVNGATSPYSAGGSGGGGGGGSGGVQSPGNGGGSSYGGVANQASPASRGATQAGPAPNQPAPPAATQLVPGIAGSRANRSRTATAQSQAEVSNSVPEDVVLATNAPSVGVSGPSVDDSMMSPPNRKAARILRDFLGGTYLLLLLLMLLYAAWRYRRWRQEVERRRRRQADSIRR